MPDKASNRSTEKQIYTPVIIALITAIIGLIGTVTVGYFQYVLPQTLSIHATQTAQASNHSIPITSTSVPNSPVNAGFVSTEANSTNPAGESSATASSTQAGNFKAWADSSAVITENDGSTFSAQADTLGLCWSTQSITDSSIPLDNGQHIFFSKIKRIEVHQDIPGDKFNLNITFLDGRNIKGSLETNIVECGLSGANDMGNFNVPFPKLKQVDILR